MKTQVKKQKIFFALGTVNILTYFDENDDKAINEAAERVLRLHDMLSAYDVNSEIGKINRAAGKEWVSVSQDTYKLICSSIAYSEMTGGAYDITIERLSMLWKNAILCGTIPTKHEIENAFKLSGYRDIMADPVSQKIMLKREGQEIDLGAIAKGYAADEVRRILEEYNVENAIINLGGTVITMGARKVGIQDPYKTTGEYFAKFIVSDKAVVSSGTYEQCRKNGDKLIHHIIDPRTGYPGGSELLSVTLVGENAMELDALSTSFLIMGIEKSYRIMKERGIEGVFITGEGGVYVTQELRSSLVKSY